MKKIYRNCMLMFSIMLMTLAVSKGFAQIHISTPEELDSMRTNTDTAYVLDNHIDLQNYDWVPFNFQGELDGNGYAIVNLVVDQPDYAGLFMNLENAVIKNLGLEDVFVYGEPWAGAIAANASNSHIEKCYATGEVQSTGIVGGLIGHATNTDILQSFTEMIVNGHDHVGGIAGHMNAGMLKNSYTKSAVFSDAWQAGGLVGWAQDDSVVIAQNYAKGTVTSESGFTGGILGVASGGEKVVHITECLALQSAMTTNNPDIEKTYRIVADHAAATYSNNYGLDTMALSDPHKVEWENDINGKDGASIADSTVYKPAFFADSLTWDFEHVWKMEGQELRLQWEDHINMVRDTFYVSDAAGMQDIANDLYGVYILENDIDMSGVTWDPTDFYGVLDGAGYTLENFTVDVADYAGLFKTIDNATIKNLHFKDAYVYGEPWAGAIAGNANNSHIYRCSVTGDVGSNGIVGGLLGHATNTTISESVVKAIVTGHDHVGGIVGHMNAGLVENSYSNSSVTSDAWQAGGIAGWAQDSAAIITKTYAMGSVTSESGFTGGILGVASGGEKVVHVTECLALHTSLTTNNPDIEKTYRIVADHAAATYSDNYGLESIELSDPHKVEWENDVSGKDGASITSAEVADEAFYADSLTWDFENVWELRDGEPRLQWEPEDPATSVETLKKETSAIKVYAARGYIQVKNAPKGAQIAIYDITGRRQVQSVIKRNHERYNVSGISIVTIQTPEDRSAFKVANFK